MLDPNKIDFLRKELQKLKIKIDNQKNQLTNPNNFYPKTERAIHFLTHAHPYHTHQPWWIAKRKRETGRQPDRDTDRDRERWTERVRETDRQTDRQSERDRQTDRQKEGTERHKQRDRERGERDRRQREREKYNVFPPPFKVWILTCALLVL